MNVKWEIYQVHRVWVAAYGERRYVFDFWAHAVWWVTGGFGPY